MQYLKNLVDRREIFVLGGPVKFVFIVGHPYNKIP